MHAEFKIFGEHTMSLPAMGLMLMAAAVLLAGYGWHSRRVAAPVLALCGELDDLALPAVVERTLRGLGVDFRLTVMQGTGHLFEHKQREVGERVAAFFAETLGRKPQNV